MKKSLVVIFFSFFLFSSLYRPSSAFSDTFLFDADGSLIDKVHYEIIAAEREKAVASALKNGYPADPKGWKDPIKLRKKRLAQWREMRAGYNPESLPKKIEN